MNLEHGRDRSREVVRLWLHGVIHLNVVRATWDIQDGCTIKELGKLLCVKCGGRDEQLQVWTTTCNILHQTKENVGMQCTLVGFVNHQSTVAAEVWLGQEFSQQHAISHVLQCSLFGCSIFETNGVSNLVSDFDSNFLGHTGSNTHSCHTTGLSTSNLHAILAVPVLVQVLWELRRFSGTRFTNDDQDLIFFDCV